MKHLPRLPCTKPRARSGSARDRLSRGRHGSIRDTDDGRGGIERKRDLRSRARKHCDSRSRRAHHRMERRVGACLWLDSRSGDRPSRPRASAMCRRPDRRRRRGCARDGILGGLYRPCHCRRQQGADPDDLASAPGQSGRRLRHRRDRYRHHAAAPCGRGRCGVPSIATPMSSGRWTCRSGSSTSLPSTSWCSRSCAAASRISAPISAANPDFVREMISTTRIIDVNDRSVELFGRGDKAEILPRPGAVLAGGELPGLCASVVAAYQGRAPLRDGNAVPLPDRA